MQRDVVRVTHGNPDKWKLNICIINAEPLSEIDACLKLSAWAIRYAKIFSAVVCMRADISEILSTCKQYGIIPYIGGGILERCEHDREVSRKVDALHRLGIDAVEVSNSDGAMSPDAYSAFIGKLRKDFSIVLGEVGRKTIGPQRHADWEGEMDAVLQAGADEIILEGTGSGRGGIYNNELEPRTLLVLRLLARMGDKRPDVFVEAPLYDQQRYWLSCAAIGWDTRLANIKACSGAQLLIVQERLQSISSERLAQSQQKKPLLDRILARIECAAQKANRPLDRFLNDRYLCGICPCTLDCIDQCEQAIARLSYR